MPEICFRNGNVVRYEKGDSVRLTEWIKQGGPTGRIYELGVYVNGTKFTNQWEVPSNTNLSDGEIERGQFVYEPGEFVRVQSVYDIAGPGLSAIDILALKQVADLLPKNALCVNIGANIGTSTITLLEERPDAFIFSIDILPYKDEFDNLARFGLADLHRVVRILGRSQDVGINWPCPVDFLFVDGAHTYADVKEDIRVWLPKLRTGGIVVFHDYGMRHTPGVKKAVDELLGDHEVVVHMGMLKAFRKR